MAHADRLNFPWWWWSY